MTERHVIGTEETMTDPSVILIRKISDEVREHLARKSAYNDLSSSADKTLKALLTRIGVWELSKWGQENQPDDPT